MRNTTSIILLLACVSFAAAATAIAKRPTLAPVVAKFGGECEGKQFHPSVRLRQLIQRKTSPVWVCDTPFWSAAFVYDLNGDRKNEFFVRLNCGATGNCTWGIFSDYPARLRGVFTAWFFYIHRRTGPWNTLTTYTREGGEQGVIATLANRRGKYLQTSERTERGYYGNSQPFFKRMGIPKCS